MCFIQNGAWPPLRSPFDQCLVDSAKFLGVTSFTFHHYLIILVLIRNAVLVISPRGPLAIRRMTAHWVVLAAAVLATLVAATMAAALTVFTGQALPLAVRHDLAAAPDTALSITTLVSDPGQAAKGSAALRSQITAAMPGLPFSFNEALWSDPLELVPGALPAAPPTAGKGNTTLLQAVSTERDRQPRFARRRPVADGPGKQRAAGDPRRLARLGGGTASCLRGRRAAAARPDH